MDNPNPYSSMFNTHSTSHLSTGLRKLDLGGKLFRIIMFKAAQLECQLNLLMEG